MEEKLTKRVGTGRGGRARAGERGGEPGKGKRRGDTTADRNHRPVDKKGRSIKRKVREVRAGRGGTQHAKTAWQNGGESFP